MLIDCSIAVADITGAGFTVTFCLSVAEAPRPSYTVAIPVTMYPADATPEGRVEVHPMPEVAFNTQPQVHDTIEAADLSVAVE